MRNLEKAADFYAAFKIRTMEMRDDIEEFVEK